jgi:protein-arginine kinase activator protein McsA
MICETCGEKATVRNSYNTKDLRVRIYVCAAQHKTKVFVKGLPRHHDPEAHLRKIKEIIAGRLKP